MQIKLPQLPDNPSQQDILSFFGEVYVVWPLLTDEQKQSLLEHFDQKTRHLPDKEQMQ